MVLILQKTLMYMIPLLIVAMAGVFAERSGIINIALEGIMIIGAFAGAVAVNLFETGNVTFMTENPQLMFVVALAISGIVGGLFSLLLSFSAINMKADQTIGGTALNMLAPALVNTLALGFFNQEKLTMPASFEGYALKNSSANPIVQIFADKAYISTYICLGLFALLSLWLYKTRTGMRMRSCGEHPQAADSVGINVYKMRYLGTTISGVLAGIGGYTYIATAAGGTAEATVGGMGFLALAIMIFGNWKPVGILLGAIMFGFLKCISAVSGSVDFFKSIGLPMYFYNILPYLVVLIVLALTAKKSGCPKAEGIPYDKGMR